MFAILYLVGFVALLWLFEDELPFLHPGKVHIYVAFDEGVTRASVGEYVLNTAGDSDTLWVEPGTHVVKLEFLGNVHTKTINVSGEAYILLDGKPPYVHGYD